VKYEVIGLKRQNEFNTFPDKYCCILRGLSLPLVASMGLLYLQRKLAENNQVLLKSSLSSTGAIFLVVLFITAQREVCAQIWKGRNQEILYCILRGLEL